MFLQYFASIMNFNFTEDTDVLGIMLKSEKNCSLSHLPNGDLMVLILRRISLTMKDISASASGVKKREYQWITWRLLLVIVKVTSHRGGSSKCTRDNLEQLPIPSHDRTSPFIAKLFRTNA
jgi:hypothetical protein